MGFRCERIILKICVYGLWHLGTVTAACLASVGHTVIGLDDGKENIRSLSKGKAPLFEPGLDDLLQKGISAGNIVFTDESSAALANVDLLWVTFDTPVDSEDRADINLVEMKVEKALHFLPNRTTVLISSQMPVGSVAKLEKFASEYLSDKELSFAYSPENLRLGKAISIFLNPDRIVVGVRTGQHYGCLENFLLTITDKIEWMSIESAEMTKHAINAFLATSICFANEIAAICELVGGDAKEVERGLKTEVRIGPRAYLSAGGAFSGGTLARDIEFLNQKSSSLNLANPLLASVRVSNDEHKKWTRRKIRKYYPCLQGVRLAIWGIAYKAGTDTLRRSATVELCIWLIKQGAHVSVYDPAIRSLPRNLVGLLTRFDSPLDAVVGSHVLIVGTDWPEFLEVAIDLKKVANENLVVIDPNRHLWRAINSMGFSYEAVGKFSPEIR